MPETEEPKKDFKVLSDEESKAAGLPTEPTAEDIAEGERARALAAAQMSEAAGPLPPGAEPVASPLVEPQAKPFAQLSPKTRREMEAGYRRLGGGGLTPEESYNKSLHSPPEPPALPTIHAEPPANPTDRSRREMEAGVVALARQKQISDHNRHLAAEAKARELAEHKPADGNTDLNYTAPRTE